MNNTMTLCFQRALAATLMGLSALLYLEPAHALEVETARLDSVWQFPQRTAPAQVVARNQSRLSAEVSGTVVRWTADVGASVRRGDVLVQIDPADLELAVQRAEAGMAAAQSRLQLSEVQFSRAQALVDQGFFSQEALAQRETEVALLQAELRSAQTQLESARRQLAKTTLRAPFNGTVVQRTVQLGESVSPGTALLTLAETGASEVQASIPPSEADSLRRSATKAFQPQGSVTGQPLQLLRISAAVDSGSRTQIVRLGLSPSANLPPGSSGLLVWNDPEPHIPASLIVRRGSQLGVFVRAGAVARFVALEGAQEGRATPTTLPAETAIVVRGQAALNDGQRID